MTSEARDRLPSAGARELERQRREPHLPTARALRRLLVRHHVRRSSRPHTAGLLCGLAGELLSSRPALTAHPHRVSVCLSVLLGALARARLAHGALGEPTAHLLLFVGLLPLFRADQGLPLLLRAAHRQSRIRGDGKRVCDRAWIVRVALRYIRQGKQHATLRDGGGFLFFSATLSVGAESRKEKSQG